MTAAPNKAISFFFFKNVLMIIIECYCIIFQFVAAESPNHDWHHLAYNTLSKEKRIPHTFTVANVVLSQETARQIFAHSP